MKWKSITEMQPNANTGAERVLSYFLLTANEIVTPVKYNICFLGNAALLLILAMQHSFPDHSKVYLYLILGVLGLELISSLTCLVIYTGETGNFCIFE